MSYTALYRKYRPASFEDVKGQQHIVRTIRNQIKADRIGHAYLFCGTRGTGKTTVAKIFARAVNCQQPVDGSPCGVCPTCKAIAAGSSLNVIEVDAASNNGVDSIRDIREEVSYPPTEGRYKVYIIDEAHNLTSQAFNALLKTLEEPPSYVIFILATTEAHSIPVTIMSRCQRYDFHRISVDTIMERLQELTSSEGVEAEEKALRYIARKADGALRDALSLLDQCIAFYLGRTLTFDHVLEVLGAVDTERFSRLLRALISRQVPEAMSQVEALIADGRDLGQFTNDFIWYLRNLLLLQSSEDMEDLLDMSSENLQLLKEEKSMIETGEIMRYIRIFSELTSQIRYSTQKRILLEVAIIKLCHPAMEQTYDSVLARLDYIEKQLAQGLVVQQVPQKPMSAGSTMREEEKPQVPKAIPEDIQKVVAGWKKIVGAMPPMYKAYLQQAHLSLGGDNVLQLVVADELAADFLSQEEWSDEIKGMISDAIGKEVEVEFRSAPKGEAFEDHFIDLEKLIPNFEIEYEDEE